MTFLPKKSEKSNKKLCSSPLWALLHVITKTEELSRQWEETAHALALENAKLVAENQQLKALALGQRV